MASPILASLIAAASPLVDRVVNGPSSADRKSFDVQMKPQIQKLDTSSLERVQATTESFRTTLCATLRIAPETLSRIESTEDGGYRIATSSGDTHKLQPNSPIANLAKEYDTGVRLQNFAQAHPNMDWNTTLREFQNTLVSDGGSDYRIRGT